LDIGCGSWKVSVLIGGELFMKVSYSFTVTGNPEKVFDLIIEYFTLTLKFPYKIKKVTPYPVENIVIPKEIVLERGSRFASFGGGSIESFKTSLKVTLTLKMGGQVTVSCNYDIVVYGTPLRSDELKILNEAKSLEKFIKENM